MHLNISSIYGILANCPKSSGTVQDFSLSHCPAMDLYTFYCLSRKSRLVDEVHTSVLCMIGKDITQLIL